MRDIAIMESEIASPLSEEQALAAINEHAKTLGKIAEQEGRWAAHINALSNQGAGRPLADAEAISLLAEHQETLELAATQKVLWHLHTESRQLLSPAILEPMADPHIIAYSGRTIPGAKVAVRKK